MKKLLFLIILLALAGFAYYHIPKHADGIEGDIHKRLSRVMLEKNVPKSIIAKVDGRDVMLSGEANSQRLKDQVNAFAENLTGVRTVNNNIQVTSIDAAESSYEPEIKIERPQPQPEPQAEIQNDIADMSITAPPPVAKEVMEQVIEEAQTSIIELETGSAVIDTPEIEIVETQIEMPPPPMVVETVKIEAAPPETILEEVVEAPQQVVERVVVVQNDVTPQTSACQNKLASIMGRENINFDSGRSTIKSNSYGLLDKLVAQVKKCNNVVIHIHGHTDNTGDSNVNRSLSLKRAKSVGRYMISKGVRQEIRVVGHGESQPIASNETESGKAQNRRIEFRITKAK
jgi:outer membrane protein OmpA-like peptidoglycan-associated protein